MSGRKINDQKLWAGTTNQGNKIFPAGPYKTREEKSAEGAGYIGMDDPDTTEDIYRDQEHGASKLEGRRMKPGYRN
jgi:hypothetical protein